jgi:sulfide:quinone oxidoreductase
MRIVVLGAGFGGLEIAWRLSNALGDDLDLVLVDETESFVFGYSKLDVMFGRTLASEVRHPYSALSMPGVRFLQATVLAIDPATRRVTTSAEVLEADALVIALGADLDPAATPGLVEAGHEFYTEAGAFALRDVLAGFEGGRVIVGVTSTPFKCPPAPSETTLLMHDFLVARGLRDRSSVSLVMPLPVPIPPSPVASQMVLAAFAEREIDWHAGGLVRALDPATQTAQLSDGTALPYDLFLGIPTHRAPAVVVESGLTVDGWVAVDPTTLATSFPGVWAVGDVASVGTPKAGVFAEGQAVVVAAQLLAKLRGEEDPLRYDGHGICWMEVGHGEIAKVDVTFVAGQAPQGSMEGPSAGLMADKQEFGRSRVARWFA